MAFVEPPTTQPDQAASSAPRYVSAVAGAYAVLGGALSFTGWAADIYRLTDWWGLGIAIKANTAVAITTGGAALLCAVFAPSRRALIRALGCFTATLGGLTLFEHLTGVDLGIDTLLFDEPLGALATAAPGRMGPPAASSFLALGVAFVLATSGPRARAASVWLALSVMAIATLSLTGYGYGAEAMYTIPRLTGIAMQTATMIVALSIGLLALQVDSSLVRTLCEESNAGILARRVMPVAFIVPLVVGWARVQGQRAGLYDYAFGAALRTLFEMAILGGLLWWSVQAIRLRDLRERRSELERRSTEQRLADTLESMTDGFVMLDRQWRFQYINAEAERILRRSRSDVIGKVIWDVFPELIGADFYLALQRTVQARSMVEIEAPDFQSGGERYFSHRVYPGSDGLSIYTQDITSRKQAEAALREADRRKDEFLATLAHELRNPLAPIRNAAAVLLRSDLPDPKLRWGAEIINRQVRHMARLLEDLLDISRLSRNRLELRQESVELIRVIESALETSRPAIEANGHAVTLEAPSEPLYISADPVRLAQVFSNLLNNAAKYTERGGRLKLTARSDSDSVVVHVEDNGVGIDADSLPHIFEMFTQATPSRGYSQGGLGIGLALARGIVELHGGSIEARSPGAHKGSEFIVRLPRSIDVVQGEAREPDADGLITPQRRRLLIADDLKDSADTLGTLLASQGHDVRTVYDGRAALEAAETFRPDAVLLDIGMPELDGLEVCRRIREAPWGRQMFIVAVTGWGQAHDRAQTGQAGFDAHLIKPVDAAALLALLNSAAATSAVAGKPAHAL